MCSLENVESIQQKFEWTALLRLPIEVLELYPLLKYVFICVLFTSLLHQACIAFQKQCHTSSMLILLNPNANITPTFIHVPHNPINSRNCHTFWIAFIGAVLRVFSHGFH